MKSPKKRVLALVGLIFGLLSNALLLEIAFAMGPNIVFTPQAGELGTEFEVKGTMFHPGERVFINWDHPAAALAQVSADASGSLTTKVTVPAGSPQGDHNVTLAGDKGSVAVHVFRIGDPVPPVSTAEDDKAGKGSDSGNKPLVTGLGGLVVGLLAGAGAMSLLGKKDSL